MKKIIYYTTILLSLTSTLTFGQVKEYFISCDPAEFEYIYQHYDEDIYIPVSITYNGFTWTNTDMCIRGDGSRSLPKKSLKVRFNDEPFINGRDKLNFNAEYEDRSYIRAFVSSRVYKMTGQHCFDTDFARLYLNGDFLGLYQMTENMDDLFLEANGYDPAGNLFKATKDGACLSIYDDLANFWEQKTGSGNKEDLAVLIENINAVSVEEYPDFCQQNFDYNQVVNMIACNMVIANQSTYYHNYYMYHDVDGSGKWEMIPWDLDKTLSVYSWRNYTYSSGLWTSDNPYMEKAILNEQMMDDIRIRAQEILDQVVNADQLWPMIDSLVEVLQPSVAQDTTDDIPDVALWLERVEVEKTVIANFSDRLNWYFNHVQSSFTAVRTPYPMPGDITFRWSSSTDPDGEPVEYRFLITTGIKFEPELTTIYEGIADTSFNIQNIEPGNYFWQVVSVDANGEEVQAFDSRNPLEVKNFTYLPCVIDEDMVLTAENSPYIVDCDVEVLANVKLSVAENVEIVFAGSYSIKIFGEIHAEGSRQNPIIFRADTDFPFWVNIKDATASVIFNFVHILDGTLNTENSDVYLNNVILENSKILQAQEGLFNAEFGNIEVRNSRFVSNNSGRGLVFSSCQSATIENCYFSQTPDAINYFNFDGGVVSSNEIIDCPGSGIVMDNANHPQIDNNIIYNATENAMVLSIATDVVIQNNLIVGCQHGINLNNNASAKLINNTLYQNNNAVWLHEKNAGNGGGHATILNTILSATAEVVILADEYSSSTLDYSLCDTEEIEGVGNFFDSPGFAGPALGNFTLLAASPCIDSGDPESDPDPDSTRADIGAFFFNQGVGNIIFNEINYKASSGFDTEDWVEIYNTDQTTTNISGWVFKDSKDDHVFKFPFGTTIEAGGYLVLCSNAAMFSALNPEVENFIGSFPYGLSSSGELIRLYNHTGILIDSVVYGVEAPWPEAPNGNGPTLELRSPLFDNTLPESWCDSGMYGTPGKVNSCFTPGLSENETTSFDLHLFPNPAVESINLELVSKTNGILEIQVFTSSGKLCYTTNQTIEHSEKHTFIINSLTKPGIYFIHANLESKNGEIFHNNSKLILIK